ncbi:DUF3099 domain-containing protein [Motilibacter aurantiacus]|uniref:DUF3099 domain-containing protein n=1 Tax=Motilibacter aurantiacus TaxID=2714955 RepID=UPI00140A6C45|nr:DUF3099 domain-containing protein [Motilibacter aurantiacus]
MAGASRRTEPVYQITGAARGLQEDQGGRARRYAISMGIRTVCFLLAVVTDGWLRWAFVAGAVALPYLAVVLANAGRETVRDLPGTILRPERRALSAGTAAPLEKGRSEG